MSSPPTPEPTAAEILDVVGRAIYDNSHDWQARLSTALGVGRSTVQYWRNGKLPFDAHHGALNDLMELVTRRRADLELAERQLRTWLERHRV
jgi:hypothetical protein